MSKRQFDAVIRQYCCCPEQSPLKTWTTQHIARPSKSKKVKKGRGSYGTVFLNSSNGQVVKVSRLFQFTPGQKRKQCSDPTHDCTKEQIEILQQHFPALATIPWTPLFSPTFVQVPNVVATAIAFDLSRQLNNDSIVRVHEITTYRKRNGKTGEIQVYGVVSMEQLYHLDTVACNQQYCLDIGQSLFALAVAGVFAVDIKSNNIMWDAHHQPKLIDLDQIPVRLGNQILIPEHCTTWSDVLDDFPRPCAERSEARRRECSFDYYIPFGWHLPQQTVEIAELYGIIDVLTRFVLNCVADVDGDVFPHSKHVDVLLKNFEREWVGIDNPAPWPVHDALEHLCRIESWRVTTIYFTELEMCVDQNGFDDDNSQMIGIATVRDTAGFLPFVQKAGFFATLRQLPNANEWLRNSKRDLYCFYKNPPGWYGDHDPEFQHLLSQSDTDRRFTVACHDMECIFDHVLWKPHGRMRVHDICSTQDQVWQLFQHIVTNFP